MSAPAAGNALVVLVMIVPAIVGLGAMALSGWALWAAALRFEAGSTGLQVAQGFALLLIVAILGAFGRSLYVMVRPLVTPSPGSKDKLNGLMLVLAPAAAGMVLSIYLLLGAGLLYLVRWVVGG